MKFNTFLVKIGLLLCAIIPLFVVHSYVFQSHLRHGMVEDGSVSQYAGDLLDNRSIFEKYQAVLESDGRANGRYRPGYYVYETIPFFLTLIKSGDYFLGMTGSEIRNHLNGDLQFHMIYLLFTVGVALWCGALIVYKVSGSMLYSTLFPLSVIYSTSVVRNITYNDTAEVPQLLAMASYLLLFFLGEVAARKGSKTTYTYFVLAIPGLIFLYLIKETTVVLFPALLLYMFISWLIQGRINQPERSYRKVNLIYLLIHLLLNGLLTLWVLFQVHSLKGGYASHYDVTSFKRLWDVFVRYSECFMKFPPIFYIPVLGLVLSSVITIFVSKNENNALAKHGQYVIRVALLFIIMACGFLFLNLPWEYVLVRYMLPSFFLMALAGATLIGFVDSRLQEVGGLYGTLPRIVMLVLILLWSYPAGVKEYKRVYQSYELEFGLHRIINIITSDIIKDVNESSVSPYNVLFDVGNMSYWMWIQSVRIINKEGKINVTVPGQKYPQERLYLKSYSNKRELILIAADGEGYNSRSFDSVYSAVPISDEKEHQAKLDRLEKLNKNYFLKEKWFVGADSPRKFNIRKYVQQIQNAQ